MSTAVSAVTPANANTLLDFQFGVPTKDAPGYYVYMHFVELEKLQGGQYRAFNIYLNEEFWFGSVVTFYLYPTTIYSKSPMIDSKYEFSLKKKK
jgi:hypothetical protein